MPEHSIPMVWPKARDLRRLGKNINGYFGETIDIAAVLRDCIAAARAHGWAVEDLRATPRLNLLAFTRSRGAGAVAGPADDKGTPEAKRRPRLYLSSGIHGDEPAGPLAVRYLLQQDQWPAQLDLWMCPCLNPEGFGLNRRENAEGLDLNRQYREPRAAEVLTHMRWLADQPQFDLCLCLHEDWESHGFYVYEANPDGRASLAEAILAQVAEVCPIDLSTLIEGRPAQNGVIRPNIDPHSRAQWPEAFFLLTRKTRLSYTLEAPSDFPIQSRVAALVVAVETAARVLASMEG